MRYIITALLGGCMLTTTGCAPLVLAGGVAAISMISQDIQRHEAARKIELQRQASLREQAAQQERARLAALERQRIEDTKRRQAAEQERQQRLAAELKKRNEEAERQRIAQAERDRERARARQKKEELVARKEAATCEARALLQYLEADLTQGRWSRSELAALLNTVDAACKTPANDEVLARVRLGAGLYAFLLDERVEAAKEWRAAHRMGLHDPRVVSAGVWTPGSVEAFRAAK